MDQLDEETYQYNTSQNIQKSDVMSNQYQGDAQDNNFVESQTQKSNIMDSIVMEVCSYCERKFFPGRLILHQKLCTQERPLRQKKASNSNNNNNLQDCNQSNKQIKLKTNSHVHEKSDNKDALKRILTKTQCSHCGKNFNSKLINKHEAECQILQKSQPIRNKSSNYGKQSYQTSTQFNTSESKILKMNNTLSGDSNQSQQKIQKWKLEHESFLQNMRQKSSKLQDSDEGNQENQSFEDPLKKNYVFCQFCQRKFAPNVADRHIPRCQNIFNRPKPPKSMPQKVQDSKNIEKEDKTISQQVHLIVNGKSKKKQLPVIIQKNKKEKFMKYTQYINHSIYEEDDEGQVNGEQSSMDQKRFTQKGQDANQQSDNDDLATQTTQAFTSPLLTKNLHMTNSNVSSDKKQQQSSLFPNIKKGQDSFSGSGQIDVKYATASPTEYKSKASPNLKTYEDVMARSTNYSQVNCPHCDRKFAPRSAERHIPICKNIVNRAKRLTEISRTYRSVDRNQQEIKQQLNQPQQNIKNMLIIQQQQQNTNLFSIQKDQQDSLILCHFCGFQCQIAHKYCGNCGKKRMK